MLLGARSLEHWKIEREERIDFIKTVFPVGLSHMPPQLWLKFSPLFQTKLRSCSD
jgi:hypothetical protein